MKRKYSDCSQILAMLGRLRLLPPSAKGGSPSAWLPIAISFAGVIIAASTGFATYDANRRSRVLSQQIETNRIANEQSLKKADHEAAANLSALALNFQKQAEENRLRHETEVRSSELARADRSLRAQALDRLQIAATDWEEARLKEIKAATFNDAADAVSDLLEEFGLPEEDDSIFEGSSEAAFGAILDLYVSARRLKQEIQSCCLAFKLSDPVFEQNDGYEPTQEIPDENKYRDMLRNALRKPVLEAFKQSKKNRKKPYWSGFSAIARKCFEERLSEENRPGDIASELLEKCRPLLRDN